MALFTRKPKARAFALGRSECDRCDWQSDAIWCVAGEPHFQWARDRMSEGWTQARCPDCGKFYWVAPVKVASRSGEQP
jgi:hypothetical protein